VNEKSDQWVSLVEIYSVFISILYGGFSWHVKLLLHPDRRGSLLNKFLFIQNKNPRLLYLVTLNVTTNTLSTTLFIIYIPLNLWVYLISIVFHSYLLNFYVNVNASTCIIIISSVIRKHDSELFTN
jgi:hypothetical protein